MARLLLQLVAWLRLGAQFEVASASASTPTPAPLCGAKGPDYTPWEARKDARIVSGQDATQCEWPWQVSLASYASGYGHFCGGTLISDTWVLTAAHCMGGNFYVVLGSHNKAANDSGQVVRAVKQVYSHPNWDDYTFAYDFALLELVEATPLSDCIGTACLPSEAIADGEECFITGWGTLYSSGPTPDILQEAQVSIVSNSDCDALYEAVYGTGSITDAMLCAQGLNNAGVVIDACQGDSGGPLVCASPGGAYVIHGATSFGYGCALAEFPGVWSRVSYVRGWIDSLVSPCADDDETAIALASGAGFTISGCGDVRPHCEHSRFGDTLQATCPLTCNSCARRLADGQGELTVPQADELDRVDELMVAAPSAPAAAAEAAQRSEELGSSDTDLLYP